MARDGTNRGCRRVRVGDKTASAAEKIQKGQQVQILKNDIPTLSPAELEAVDLPEGVAMEGMDMPKPSDYLSARQKNGIPLGADEIYRETWLWLKERGCEGLVNPRLIEAYAQDDDFDVDAELEKPTVTKSGDLWLLGNHRLLCGDSIKEENYTILMNGKKANLVVTDPSYNVNYQGIAGKIKNDNLENDKFYQFLFDAITCMEKAMEDDASIYVFYADTEGLNFRKVFADAGFYLSGTCIWKKQSLVLGRSPYQWQHEPCLFL